MERLISRREASELLGISIKTLDQARLSGSIAYVQYVDNGNVYFTETALEEFVARCTHRTKLVPHTKPMKKKKKNERTQGRG